MKKIILLFIGLSLFSSCEKDEEVKPSPDERYPYTYYALNQSEWDQLNTEFNSFNVHDSLYLDEYGFLQGKLFLEENAEINADLVVSLTESLLETYRNFMGIESESTINVAEDIVAIDYMMAPIGTTDVYDFFDRVVPAWIEYENMWAEFHEYEYVQEPFTHYFFLPQNSLSKSQLISTRLNLYFSEVNKSVGITGNWYPEAFIPSSQIYTKEDAVDIASGAFKNEVDENIWNEDKVHNAMHTKVTLYPVVFDERIEIHEIWDITAYGNDFWMYYNIYVDTQTGEILYKHSDVIPH